jgi:UDP-N-acetylmuramoyl-L-alanyl-D-glutamate--2,6-diaminopimelate ligase
MLKSAIRSLLPEPVLSAYHFSLGWIAAAIYGFPSESLTVIGVTGTNGKSSTVSFIGQALESAGETVGWTSTASFKIAGREWANAKKMTMLGRFATQKILRDMVKAGCRYAVVETSSQGVLQHRHRFINYDVAVFTNLTPEHIEAHGGFENYKKAKGEFFAHLSCQPKKPFEGALTQKAIVVNVDDEHAPYFLSFKEDRKFGYGVEGKTAPEASRASFVPVIAKAVASDATCSTFRVEDRDFHVKLAGRFNLYNALAAVAACRAAGLDWDRIVAGIAALKPVPGRLETIEEGQPFAVIVDYAYEPAALNAVYETLSALKKNRLIHVLGSAGGGRDVSRRPILGRLAAEHADVVIVTNEDPYDEDPRAIIDQVADGAMAAGKRDAETLFRIDERQDAIGFALELARPGDLVLITGKGSEPVMAVAHGKKIPWDDRIAVRRALAKRGYGKPAV